MANMKDALLSIIAAAILCGIVTRLIGKKGIFGGFLKLLTGVFLALCVFSPFWEIPQWSYSSFTENLSEDAAYAASLGEQMADEAIAGIIKERSEAYILDKAAALNLDIRVDIEIDNSESPTPCAVTIHGAISPLQKEILSSYIHDELAIPEEAQVWK